MRRTPEQAGQTPASQSRDHPLTKVQETFHLFLHAFHRFKLNSTDQD